MTQKQDKHFYFLLSLCALVLAGLTACGGGKNPDKERSDAVPASQNIDGYKYEMVSDPSAFTVTAGTLEGTGTVRMVESLKSINSGSNFIVNGGLEPGGHILILAYTKNDLQGGVTIMIERNSNPNDKLLGVRLITSQANSDISPGFFSVDATGPLALAFDVHNDHADGVHVLAWNEMTEKLIFEGSFKGKGLGDRWGMSLQSAKVTKYKGAEARDKD